MSLFSTFYLSAKLIHSLHFSFSFFLSLFIYFSFLYIFFSFSLHTFSLNSHTFGFSSPFKIVINEKIPSIHSVHKYQQRVYWQSKRFGTEYFSLKRIIIFQSSKTRDISFEEPNFNPHLLGYCRLRIEGEKERERERRGREWKREKFWYFYFPMKQIVRVTEMIWNQVSGGSNLIENLPLSSVHPLSSFSFFLFPLTKERKKERNSHSLPIHVIICNPLLLLPSSFGSRIASLLVSSSPAHIKKGRRKKGIKCQERERERDEEREKKVEGERKRMTRVQC